MGGDSAYDMGWNASDQAGTDMYHIDNAGNNNSNSLTSDINGVNLGIPSFRMKPEMTACEKCRLWFLPAMFLNLFNVLGGFLAYKSIETTSVDVNNTIFQGQAVFTYFGSAIVLGTKVELGRVTCFVLIYSFLCLRCIKCKDIQNFKWH